MARSPGKLATYRAKRNFERTQEPRGRVAKRPGKGLRFVIQKHAARRLHYDLRLELAGVFKSWAVTKGPSLDPAIKRLAVEVEDHPLDYGDFEGTIPKGEYGGGTVMLWDRGYWEPEGPTPPARALENGELKFILNGEKLRGGFVLVRLRHDRERPRSKRTNWLLIKHRDGTESTRDIDAAIDDRSVASGRTMADIASGRGNGPRPFVQEHANIASPAAVWSSAAGGPIAPSAPTRSDKPIGKRARMPGFIPPQLCRTLDKPPDDPGWVHEIKLDGYRVQLRIERDKPRLFTRSGLDWTHRFKPIAAAARAAGFPDAILDGEIVALSDHGNPSFAALQAALDEGKPQPLVYFAFDLLYADGRDLRDVPLVERKQRLAALLASQRSGDALRYVDHIAAAGGDVIRSACDMGLEGIVSKRLDAPYRSGRTQHWSKAKCRPGQEVVVGGWSRNGRKFRSLLVGVHRNGRLEYAGRVGTGFNAAIAADLTGKLRTRTSERSPFEGKGAPRKTADITWVRPDLVAEIEFAGWTGEGYVRQAAFKGIRSDKAPREIVQEPVMAARKTRVDLKPGSSTRRANVKSGTVEVMSVAISNPGKELWPATATSPAYTKLDLARYLEDAAPFMMPHLEGIPCSIIRAPDGIEGDQQFFQRHASQGMSDLVSEVIVEGDRKPYIQLDRPQALAAVAQMGGVELHPWNCAPHRPQVPGRLVFDLDPGPDVPFDRVILAAKEMRDRLHKLGLTTFCKTTGGKGLHVVAPLKPRARDGIGWLEAKAFAQAVCAAMAADSPDRYLIKMTKALRGGRIFLDYLRNDRMSTAVAVLSPRARPGAPVSMPLDWPQVRAGLDPQRFTMRTALGLLRRSKPWRGYDKAACPLGPAIKRSAVVTRT